MFSIVVDRFISVADFLTSSSLNNTCRRQLTAIYLQEWHSLQNKFLHFSLDSILQDKLLWRWSSKHIINFHCALFYKWLEHGEILNNTYNMIWYSKISLKIKIFLWLVGKNKILTKVNLLKRGWQEATDCVFCGQPKTTKHFFVNCSYIRLIWIGCLVLMVLFLYILL